MAEMEDAANITMEVLTTAASNWLLQANHSSNERSSDQSNDSVVLSPNSRLIRYPRGATIFAAVCCILFIVIGVLGNLVTVVALSRCAKLRNATTAFVVSLCTADLLFCALNLPLTASRYINEEWLLGDALCQLFPFFFYGNVAASLMSMTAITINRYVLINHYHLYDKIYQRKYVILMILAYWTFSFGMMVPPLAGVWGRLGHHPETFSCTILSHDGKSPKKFLFILGFLLPCIVIIVSYSCIFYKVHRSRQNLTAHSPPTPGNGSNGTSPVTPTPFTSQGLLRPEEIHLTRLMLIIFCSFLVCFLPLMIVNVFDNDLKYPAVHVVASILAWMSSVINPFIYAAMNRQYRQAYVKLLCPSMSASFTRSSNGSSRSSSYSKTLVSEVFHFNAATNKMESKGKKQGKEETRA